MLHTHLETFASWAPDEPFLVTDWETIRYGEALATSKDLAARIQFLGLDRFGILLPDTPEQIFVLLGAAAAGATVCLLDSNQSDTELQRQIDELGLDGLIVADDTRLSANAITYRELLQTTPSTQWTAGTPGKSRCIIMTRGRTSLSRGAEYLWQDLLAQGDTADKIDHGKWLLAQPTSSFWGIATLMRVLMTGGALLMPSAADPATRVQMARDHHATHVSTTTSAWDEMLAECTDLDIDWLELGGEQATAEVLARTQELLPNTEIIQVYGTTELGICFTVVGACDGFDNDILTAADPSAIRVRDGMLEARTAHGMHNYSGEECDRRGRWQATGDLVIQKRDRFHFAGQVRASVKRAATDSADSELQLV